jgi:hypothetical protein
MTEEQHQPPDDLWAEFQAVNDAKNERLEQRYKEIEDYNAIMLNQVAGIEDSVFEIKGRLTDEGIDPFGGPDEIRGKPFRSLLFLQPDIRQDLQAQGESGQNIVMYGDPHVIRGEISPRTQKLVEDLFASTNATKDDRRSKPTWEIWRGDVAGQPIEFDVHKDVLRQTKGSEETVIPTLAIYVNRRDAYAKLYDLGANHKVGAEKGIDSNKRKPDRREFMDRLRGKIFPKRRKY